MGREIKSINNSLINRQLWDDCINNANNGLIYGVSSYLDQVCPNWCGLIMDDYQAVMPVFPAKKWGINYYFNPVYIQQCGVFSKQNHEFYFTDKFFSSINREIKYIDLQINHRNLPPKGIKLWKEKRVNQILSLASSYDNLYSHFTESHKKNLRRSLKNAPSFNDTLEMPDFFSFKEKHKGNYHEDLSILKRLAIHNDGKYEVKYFAVKDMNHNIVAVAMFVLWKNRLTWLSSAVSKMGKEQKAMFFLVSQLISKYANTETILDFAGSSMSGIWYFNNGFGAKDEIYYHIIINRLPRLIQFLKK